MQKCLLTVHRLLSKSLVWSNFLLVAGCVALLLLSIVPAQSFTNTLTGTSLTVSNNGQKTVVWPRLPALETNLVTTGSNILSLTTQVASTNVSRDSLNYQWNTSNHLAQQFFAIRQTQLSSNDLLAANILNRMAYGPTPEELDAVRLNPQAYIDQQLAPETIPSTIDSYTVLQTNSISLPPNSNWTIVTVTGTVSTATGPLYMYLRDVGDAYIDDVRLSLLLTNIMVNCTTNYVTNASPPFDVTTNIACTTNFSYYLGPNVLTNADFEQAGSGVPAWSIGTNYVGSATSTSYACSGTRSCHMVCTTQGPAPNFGTGNSSIQQSIAAGKLTNNHRCVLSFAYLPGPKTHLITLRLSGTGIIATAADERDPPSWVYVTQTGTASSSNLYIYLTGLGGIQSDLYIDDIKLVSGTVAEAGQNLIRNGDFESPLTDIDWYPATNMVLSSISGQIARSGTGSLHVVATSSGSTFSSAIVQSNIAGMVANQTYTLSYWYTPGRNPLTVRLSGSGINSLPDNSPGGLRRRLDAANWGVTLNELRMWFCGNGVNSPRQLLEILNQFFENHFVTYHAKTGDYFDRYYDGQLLDNIPTDLEYRENSRWRAALLNPNCTFYDLLKIHAESPAEIIYLDTVSSRGDGDNIANENYSREILELFCMGVDNGYDQYDIVAQSRAWTGWTVNIVDRDQMDNPFAPQSLQYGYYPGDGFNAVSNLVGVWTFSFNSTWHGTNRAPILSEWAPNTPATNPVAIGPKRYAARFGPPWAGQAYQINIPRRTGTNGIQDGYDVIANLANNIHTAEYISVKLCRVFVHDSFPNPTTKTNLPEYAFYDYTNPNRSPEAELIRQCIVAWDTPGTDGRKGHIRSVLRTIFNSDLFRSHAGSRQKVKTPLEFCLSAVRALRSVDGSGVATAFTDGNIASPLSRMGSMNLFNRPDPDGYPETAPPWISAGTLAERLRFVQTLCSDPGQTGGRTGDAGNNTVNPLMLVQRKLPQPSWTNAGDVADLFLYYLYFGEGKANLDLYRQAAIDFLNDGSTDTGGATTRTFAQLTNLTPNSSYDYRLRGMVSMLMTMQRFQEQ